MKWLRVLWFFAFGIATSVFGGPSSAEFDRFVDEMATKLMHDEPLSATSSQYFEGEEQNLNDQQIEVTDLLGPLLPAERAERDRWLAETGRRLATFEPAHLSSRQQITLETLKWRVAMWQKVSAIADYNYVFNQFAGLHVGLVGSLTQTHPIRRSRDVENYLIRLSRVAEVLRAGIAAAKEREAKGLVPPRVILEVTIAGIDRFLQGQGEANVFVASLVERMGKVPELTPKFKAVAAERATALVSKEIIPAFVAVRALLASELAHPREGFGLGELPGGREAYAVLLSQYTSSNLTPDEVHQLGLREVARIEKQMDLLLRDLGYTEGSVQKRYAALNATMIPPETPDPRDALLRQISETVKDAEVRSRALFDVVPKSPIEVRREPPFTEQSAAAHYSPPASDGSKPGIYFCPLATLSPDIIWLGAGMRSVAYHEAVPGHHFQIALQAELPNVPRYQQKSAFGLYTAYTEGWALYAERLAAEAGWYEGDPRGRLGQLQGELFRARRLVVDTGLHIKGWTRQQAIDYGMSAAEVERYLVLPGQACAYKVGELRLLALREKAQKALGNKFSLKRFHAVVLATGSVPLPVLELAVDHWISEEQGPKAT